MKKEMLLLLIKKISIVALITLVGSTMIMVTMGVLQYRYHRYELMDAVNNSTELIRNELDEKLDGIALQDIKKLANTPKIAEQSKEYVMLQEKLRDLMLFGNIKYIYFASKEASEKYIYVIDYGNAYVSRRNEMETEIEPEIIPYIRRAFLGETFLSEEIMKTGRGYVATSFIPIGDNGSEVDFVLGIEFDMQSAVMQMKRAKEDSILTCLFTEILVIIVSAIIYYGSHKKYQKQIEQSVEKAETTEQLLLQIASLQACGIIAYSLPKRKILMFNKEALRIYDLKDESEIKSIKFDKGAVTYVLEEDKERLQTIIKKLKNVGDVINYQYRVRHHDGQVLTILAYSKLVRSVKGEIIVVSSLLDMTKQAKLQNELQFERRQYRDAMIKNSEFAFFVDLTSGMVTEENILQAHIKKENNIMQQLPMSYDKFTLAWKKIMEPVFENTEIDYIVSGEFLLQKYRQGQTKLETDCYSITQEAYYRMIVLLSESEENHHIYACIMVMDITDLRIEERKVKVALEEACKAANRANQAKSEFLSRMSHDIRTPLNGIMGMLEIANKNIDDPEKLKYCHNKIHMASDYLLAIVNDVLDMSRLEKGKIKFVNESFDFKQIVKECVEIVLPLAQEKKVNIKFDDIESLQYPYIHSSCLHVRQIIMNIVSNAIKYNKPSGNVEIKVEEQPLSDEEVMYYIYVSDTGIGMDEAFQTRMFEPFVQENEKHRTNYMGTGLGLTIVKQLVEQMRGNIKVHSKKDVGSTFIISLPFKIAKAEDAIPANKELHHEEVLKGKKVLLVEDNDLNAEIAQFMLEENGMEVVRAEHGQKAVELFSRSVVGYFDLVLMDIMMPIMDGLTATKSIQALDREDAKKVLIIAMTANAYEADIKASIEAGMQTHLSKPLKQEKLVETITKFLKA